MVDVHNIFLNKKLLSVAVTSKFLLRIPFSFIAIQPNDGCAPYNTFEDNRKYIVWHTVQYFVAYNFGRCDCSKGHTILDLHKS